MPQAYVKKLAKKHKMSVSAAEGHWEAAKKSAAKQGHEEDYDYVTGIFKKMMGEAVVSEWATDVSAKPRNLAAMKAAVEQYKSKKISREEALKTLQDNGYTVELANKHLSETVVVTEAKGGPFKSRAEAVKDARSEIGGGSEGINFKIEIKDGEYYWDEDIRLKKQIKESAKDKVAKAVKLVCESKHINKLKEKHVSSFKDFLINEGSTKQKVGYLKQEEGNKHSDKLMWRVVDENNRDLIQPRAETEEEARSLAKDMEIQIKEAMVPGHSTVTIIKDTSKFTDTDHNNVKPGKEYGVLHSGKDWVELDLGTKTYKIRRELVTFKKGE